jgi:hypothetical protein
MPQRLVQIGPVLCEGWWLRFPMVEKRKKIAESEKYLQIGGRTFNISVEYQIKVDSANVM